MSPLELESRRTLQNDWRDAGISLGLPIKSRAWLGVYHDLLGRHTDPRRHYHRIEHVAAVLRSIVELTAELDPTLVLAAFFHDAIYDPTRRDNETKSAELATTVLTALNIDPDTRTVVVEIIEATATHQLPADPLSPERCAVFLDADLSILGAFPKTYEWYAEAIRAEYTHMSPEAFASGRADVLRSFLDRERLYFTDAGYAIWEQTARRNLTREIATLERQV